MKVSSNNREDAHYLRFMCMEFLTIKTDDIAMYTDPP